MKVYSIFILLGLFAASIVASTYANAVDIAAEKLAQRERKLLFNRDNELFERTYRKLTEEEYTAQYGFEGAHDVLGVSSQPIIGIVTQPAERDMGRPNTSVIHTEYVSWVEQSGARALIIPYDASDALMERLLQHVSGLIFQGGETELIDRLESRYLQTSIRLLNFAWEYNVPVFGICLGFELLMVWGSGNPRIILDRFNSENTTMPLLFESDARRSRLFSQLDEENARILQTLPVTINLHHNGITRETFYYAKLDQYFRIISYNYDLDGKNFISTVESHHKPFYGVQFHPERNAYIQNPFYATNRSPEALKSQRYFSDFFVAEARRYNDGSSVPCCTTYLERYFVHRYASTWLDDPQYMKRAYFFVQKDLE